MASSFGDDWRGRATAQEENRRLQDAIRSLESSLTHATYRIVELERTIAAYADYESRLANLEEKIRFLDLVM